MLIQLLASISSAPCSNPITPPSNSTIPPWGKYINFNVPSAFHIQGNSAKYLNFNVSSAIQRPRFIELSAVRFQRSSCKGTPNRFAQFDSQLSTFNSQL